MDTFDNPDRILPEHEMEFSRLKPENYKKTSDNDPDYNCVAFAVGETEKWIDPTPNKRHSWPKEVRRGFEIDVFIDFFRSSGGFTECESGALEQGFEKLALYADVWNRFRHVARLLESGKWTSKLGEWEDIEHDTLESLAGKTGWSPVKYLKRPIPQN